jgi:hypothetical protein
MAMSSRFQTWHLDERRKKCFPSLPPPKLNAGFLDALRIDDNRDLDGAVNANAAQIGKVAAEAGYIP